MVMKLFGACLMFSFFTFFPAGMVSSVFAQEQPPSAEDIVAKMQSKLNLTQDQASAITPIIAKYAAKRGDLRQSIEDGTADKSSIRSQMKQLRTDEKQELAQVLSADQMAQWSSMQKQGRHKNRGDSDSEGGGNGGSNGQ